MRTPTSKQIKKLREKKTWSGLVQLKYIPAFSAWLLCRHDFISQSPDTGEVMRAYRNGITIRILIDDTGHTRCGRHVMALYYSFMCFCIGDGR